MADFINQSNDEELISEALMILSSEFPLLARQLEREVNLRKITNKEERKIFKLRALVNEHYGVFVKIASKLQDVQNSKQDGLIAPFYDQVLLPRGVGKRSSPTPMMNEYLGQT